MRTIGDIIGAVEESTQASEEELRLTLISLWHALMIADGNGADAIKRRWTMVHSTPDKYLGPRWTPGTDENARGRAMSFAIAKRAGVIDNYSAEQAGKKEEP